MRKRVKKDRKIEPWRIIVGMISIVFILFLWVKNDIASTFTTMPKEQAIPLIVTTVVVSAVKVAVIVGVILLIKWVMAYALSYLSIYNNQLNVPKMHREMNNLMIIYGLSDMIYRGMTLVKFYAPNGVMLSEILHSCFCSHYNKTDVEVQQELGIGRTSFYKMKKQALGYLGFYFYEIVVAQAKDKRFKPSLGVEEE